MENNETVFLSDKGNLRSQIKLIENDELIQNDDKVAETLNTFFKNAVSTLDINENSYIVNNESSTILDPMEKAIKKYEVHPSILLIKNKIGNEKSFKFEAISVSDIEKEIKTLNPEKATPSGNIHSKILKLSSDTTATTLQELFNESLSNCEFPDTLKLADIVPVFKKKNPLDKADNIPVSILPHISKIYEELLQKQINNYIENTLSPYLCGYTKGHSTNMLCLIEKWKKILDEKGFCGAVLMNLSKSFDTINHELLIAKIHTYGFEKSALK